MSIQNQWYGKTDYLTSLEIMARAAESAEASGDISILGFEYEPVITVGRRAASDAQDARADNMPVVAVSRGGLATLHNPGQAVIYPIVPIKHYGLFAKAWIDLLTTATKNALTFCNIIVSSTNAGVFTPTGKIASIGIHIKRGVSTHGIAINISNNLSDFSKIIPCGVAGQRFDRVGNYKIITPEAFFPLWTEEFARGFAPYFEQTLTNAHVSL